jgi:thiamine biosynthesis lipoprotein ApbE
MEEIEALLALVGWSQVRWERPWVSLPRTGMELDFGGFVKEYAADAAAQVCREHRIEHGLVELGGDIRVIGPHPDGTPWRVGVRHPRDPSRPLAAVDLLSGAIASSGDYERFMIVDGRRYAHILDARTGWPVEDSRRCRWSRRAAWSPARRARSRCCTAWRGRDGCRSWACGTSRSRPRKPIRRDAGFHRCAASG